MENREYVFTPMGDQPTVQNIKKGLFISIVIITVVCMGAAIYSNPGHRVYSLFAFNILCLIVIIMKITGNYILNIRIDPVEGVLYSTYLTFKGEEGVTEIDIRDAKYSYVYYASKSYQGYILTIKDQVARLQLRETKSIRNKDQNNRFLKSQLHEMNEIILEVQNHNH